MQVFGLRVEGLGRFRVGRGAGGNVHISRGHKLESTLRAWYDLMFSCLLWRRDPQIRNPFKRSSRVTPVHKGTNSKFQQRCIGEYDQLPKRVHANFFPFWLVTRECH